MHDEDSISTIFYFVQEMSVCSSQKKTYAANSDKEIIIEMRNADNSRFRSDLDHHAVVEIYWICTIYTLARYITYCFVTKAIILITYLRYATYDFRVLS